MHNKITLLGRVGKEPKLRETQNSQVCQLSLATEHSRKIGEKWEKETTWHTIIVWGKRAGFIAKNAKVGDVMFFEGRMSYRDYTDRDGNKKTIAEVIVEKFNFTKPLGQQSTSRNQQQSDFGDDDIPF